MTIANVDDRGHHGAVTTIADRLNYLLKLYGLGTNELNRLADLPGGEVSRLATGTRKRPNPVNVQKIADALKIPFDWLFFGKGEAPTAPASIDRPVDAIVRDWMNELLEERFGGRIREFARRLGRENISGLLAGTEPLTPAIMRKVAELKGRSFFELIGVPEVSTDATDPVSAEKCPELADLMSTKTFKRAPKSAQEALKRQCMEHGDQSFFGWVRDLEFATTHVLDRKTG